MVSTTSAGLDFHFYRLTNTTSGARLTHFWGKIQIPNTSEKMRL
jgi:hypothetical protein